MSGTGRGVGRWRLVHHAPDQQPGRQRQAGEHAIAHAPAPVLHHPGQRRAGEDQPQPAHAHAHAREEGKTLGRKVPRHEQRGGQEHRRAAHADQQLPGHQPAVAGRQRRQRRAGDGQRERGQHRAAQAVDVHADAHQQLRHAEGQAEQPGKGAQGPPVQPEVGLQAGCQDGGDGAKRLAHGKGRQQGQQHQRQARRAGRGGRWGHEGSRRRRAGHCARGPRVNGSEIKEE